MSQPDPLPTSLWRSVLVWGVLGFAVLLPVLAALQSPLLQWRDPVYILAGFAGIVAMGVMLVQPFLATATLPALSKVQSRTFHRKLGGFIVVTVVIHVGGLWITSPPDVIDVLLLRSPTPFAVWGFAAMWAVFAAALLARFRHYLSLRLWRWGHTVLVVVVVLGTVVHAVQITGTMEPYSKAVLSLGLIGALGLAIARRKVWRIGLRGR